MTAWPVGLQSLNEFDSGEVTKWDFGGGGGGRGYDNFSNASVELEAFAPDFKGPFLTWQMHV